MCATILPSSVRPCSSDTFSNYEDTALQKTPARLCLRPSSPLAPREDSRIEANLDWHLKAQMNHLVIGNSAFFSRSEKATFAEILKLDSMSQVSDPKKSKTVPPRWSNASPFITCNRITLCQSTVSSARATRDRFWRYTDINRFSAVRPDFPWPVLLRSSLVAHLGS